MKIGKIIRNAAKCKKCGDEIESTHTHNFVTCSCGAIAIDGGKDYFKRSGNPQDFIDCSITEPSIEILKDLAKGYQTNSTITVDDLYRKL